MISVFIRLLLFPKFPMEVQDPLILNVAILIFDRRASKAE